MSISSLITGGAGFIGSHLAEALLERGHEAIVLDDLSTGSRENLSGVAAHPRLRVLEGLSPMTRGYRNSCARPISSTTSPRRTSRACAVQ